MQKDVFASTFATLPLSPQSQFIGVVVCSEDCKNTSVLFVQLFFPINFVVQATSQATQMVKSKSMEVVHAVQGDLNEVIYPTLGYLLGHVYCKEVDH